MVGLPPIKMVMNGGWFIIAEPCKSGKLRGASNCCTPWDSDTFLYPPGEKTLKHSSCFKSSGCNSVDFFINCTSPRRLLPCGLRLCAWWTCVPQKQLHSWGGLVPRPWKQLDLGTKNDGKIIWNHQTMAKIMGFWRSGRAGFSDYIRYQVILISWAN